MDFKEKFMRDAYAITKTKIKKLQDEINIRRKHLLEYEVDLTVEKVYLEKLEEMGKEFGLDVTAPIKKRIKIK